MDTLRLRQLDRAYSDERDQMLKTSQQHKTCNQRFFAYI